MIKKLLKTTAKKIINKAIDKYEKSNKIDNISLPNKKEPTVAGLKWTTKNQKLVLDLMDRVPKENRTYH